MSLVNISIHHVLMIFLAISIVFFALVLAGCSSSHPGLPNIYLVSLSYQNASVAGSSGINKNLGSLFTPLVGNAQLTVRTGYFGLCISSNNDGWTCGGDAAILAKSINATQDPLNLIAMSVLFKDKIAFSGLMCISLVLGFVCICILASLPRSHKESDERGDELRVKAFPVQSVLTSECWFSGVAVFFGLISLLWQHTAAVAAATAAQNFAYGFVNSEVGAAAMGLGWASLGSNLISLMGTIGTLLMLRALDHLDPDLLPDY